MCDLELCSSISLTHPDQYNWVLIHQCKC